MPVWIHLWYLRVSIPVAMVRVAPTQGPTPGGYLDAWNGSKTEVEAKETRAQELMTSVTAWAVQCHRQRRIPRWKGQDRREGKSGEGDGRLGSHCGGGSLEGRGVGNLEVEWVGYRELE
jgi:hypothetical protein